MRMCILAHGCRTDGSLSVAFNIISALRRLAPQHEYLFIFPTACGYDRLELPPSSQAQYYRPSASLLGRALYDLTKLPGLVRRFKPDVVWGFACLGLSKPPCKQVLLFHRVTPLYPRKHKQWYRLIDRVDEFAFMHRLRACLRRTQLVFCQTPVSKRRLAEVTGYQGTIEIMPNAVSEVVLADAAPDESPPFEKKAGEFVLFCLTRYYGHKNLEAIVEMFHRFPERLDGVKCVLTIAAEQHPHARRLLERIRQLGLEDRVVNAGPLKQGQLAWYYRHVDALLFPTILESFSGTYLEAMHFGTPILTSDLDFAHEVCGDAALYFDAWDVADMCRAVEQVRSDAGLRAALVARGRERHKQYVRSWDSIVTDALHSIERVVESDGEQT